MHKRKKRLLGLIGLVVVAAITWFASTLPTPMASANSSATTEITVTVYSVVPNVVIEPLGTKVMAAVDVESIYSNVTEVEYRLLYDDGVAHDELIEMFYPPIPPGENTASGTRTLTVNLPSYGDYTVKAIARNTHDGGFSEDLVDVRFVPLNPQSAGNDENGNPEVQLDYDPTVVCSVRLQAYYKNPNGTPGEPFFGSPKVYQLPVPGNTIVLTEFSEQGLESQDFIIEVTACGCGASAGEPVGDSSVNPSIMTVSYIKPSSPDTPITPGVPHTGAFFAALVLSRSDYLITSLIVFFSLAFFAIVILGRKKKASR